MARPKVVSEELAASRNTRQDMLYLTRCIETLDRNLADQLARVVAAQQALDLKLDLVTSLFEQYAQSGERERLESLGFVVQANEVLRNLRDDVRKAPALTANAVAVAVGAAAAGDGHAVEVGTGAGARPRPRRGLAS